MARRTIDADDFSNPDYFYVPIPTEVAIELLESFGEQWEGTNKFDGFYQCLKERLELNYKHHAPHMLYPKTFEEIEQELKEWREAQDGRF
jgi:hypothetical protein